MTIAITIGITLIFALLALFGYTRDLSRGILSLAGTFLGVALTDFWGQRWGQQLAEWLGGDARTPSLVVRSTLFLLTVLLIGYGGGAFLERMMKPTVRQKLVGALLGLCNGVLITGYMLRFATQGNASFTATVQADPLARILSTQLQQIVLGMAGVLMVLVIGRFVVRFFQKKTAKPPLRAPMGAMGGPGPTPQQAAPRAEDAFRPK